MNNLLRVMALSEDELHSVVFVKGRDEGGINVVFDPMAGKDLFQVFIHKKFGNSTLLAPLGAMHRRSFQTGKWLNGTSRCAANAQTAAVAVAMEPALLVAAVARRAVVVELRTVHLVAAARVARLTSRINF